MKAGPGQKEWEPATGKTVKFSDVHGIDEAKEVCVGFGQFLERVLTMSCSTLSGSRGNR